MDGTAEIAQLLKDLRTGKGLSQTQFAEIVGVTQSTVSEWEAGKDVPSAKVWQELASGAPYPLNIRFWKQGGTDLQAMFAAAEKELRQRGETLAGEIFHVSRFRETHRGREEAGSPIPLPTEFIPNRGSTVCLVVDDKAAVVDSPNGVFIVDESERDSRDLRPFWGREVFAGFRPPKRRGRRASQLPAQLQPVA